LKIRNICNQKRRGPKGTALFPFYTPGSGILLRQIRAGDSIYMPPIGEAGANPALSRNRERDRKPDRRSAASSLKVAMDGCGSDRARAGLSLQFLRKAFLFPEFTRIVHGPTDLSAERSCQ